ncbi:NAD(P)-dependent oxidoreductase [Rubritalea marina]|uniref:NAD(P)-dependent oxidoreductase n=1 Tax=Rubritalea marina TaxID=361055 RepID=UPI00039A77EB|nr:NAD(P)-dependent oxidoreductase [Rubritalea marina]
MKPKIGIVGLGRMGANIARHLNDEGYDVAAVYDLNQDVAGELAVELGAQAASSLPQVTAASQVVITVVSDDAAMLDIFKSQGDTLLIGAEGVTFINCATLSPEAHLAAAEAAQAVGAHALEAAMASSIPQARNGSLYLMVGGDAAVVSAQNELLECMSVALRHVGPVGAAAKVKALVNMVMNMNTAALAEGLGLGDALGLDLEMLCEVFSQTGANSRVLETDAEDMLTRDHECYFSASHAAKDSGIANALAQQAGIKTPISDATEAQFRKMEQLGLGELDKSGVAELTFKGRGA